MQNEQFWKKLDRITSKPQTIATTNEFLKILAEGYFQKLEILILGVVNLKDADCFNQVCIKNDGKEGMLYFTDRRHVKFCKGMLPAGSMYMPKCLSVNICDVINNALKKDEITSLVFNLDSKNMYIIPKLMLALHFWDIVSFLRERNNK